MVVITQILLVEKSITSLNKLKYFFNLQGMTPEQIKKRERFIRNRQKQMAEKKAKREAELEKKRK